MIKSWKLFNFKSIQKETELEFAPLTIFAGANSSGKSAFLQSILLVAQTLAHKISSRSVVLNGAFTRLGQFDDLRSVDSDADQIVIGWTCSPLEVTQDSYRPIGYRRFSVRRGRQRLSSVSCEFAFDTDPTGKQREVTQVHPRLFSTKLTAITRDPSVGESQFAIIIRRATVVDQAKERWVDAVEGDHPLSRASLQYDVDIDEASLEEIREEIASAKVTGCLLRHFLPERLSLGADMVEEDARLIAGILVGEGPRGVRRHSYPLEREIYIPSKVLELLFKTIGALDSSLRDELARQLQHSENLFGTSRVMLNSFIDALRRLHLIKQRKIRQALQDVEDFDNRVLQAIRDERGEERAIITFRTPGAISEASMYLDHFFSTSVRYLGPLRDEPKSLYPLAPTADPLDVGLKGEHTAAVLELHKNSQIHYIPTMCYLEPEIKARPIIRSLETAVIDWLKYLGIAEAVHTRDRGKLGHELNVNVSDCIKAHDLTHVGVGVSQVLPILVVSLLAEPDTTMIFEQPELHLHPKVQTLLADFFLSMTMLGKQCIIETHSEYLINRLRFRAAAAIENNPWVSATKVYFVERSAEGTGFQEIVINEFGAVLDWPEGFFDQSQNEAEAILNAAARKRKAKRRK